jgi:hypothetical protein
VNHDTESDSRAKKEGSKGSKGVTAGKSPHRLGELLLSSSVLSDAELEHAVELSSETGLPMGRVLVMCGYISERELEAAVRAQSLVKDGALELAKAKEAIQLMSKKGMDFDKCLKSVGFVRESHEPAFRLGEILVEAQILTKVQMKESLRTSQETGLPLGRILVLTSAISEEMLSAALTAQVLVRDRKISSEQAIQALKSSRFRRVNIEVSLMDLGFYKPPPRQRVRIGELLVLSGLVNEPDLMTALELGLIREAPVGQMLVEGGFISKRILDTALKLQEIVSSHSLSALKASEALRRVAVHHVSLARAISELDLESGERKERVRLGEMLKACGIVGDTEIKKALKDASRNSALLGKILLVTGVIDEHTLHAALRLLLLIRSEQLTMEQAIMALNHARKHKLTVDEALAELKWTCRLPYTDEEMQVAADDSEGED